MRRSLISEHSQWPGVTRNTRGNSRTLELPQRAAREGTLCMATQDLPAGLEPLRVYLNRAAELKAAMPVVSHYVRVFAMHIAKQLRGQIRADDFPFLQSLMDELEREKQTLAGRGGADDPRKAIRDFALNI